MALPNISFYRNIRNTKSKELIPLESFLDKIRDVNIWDEVLDYHAGRINKDQLPAVTLSGEFSERKKKGLIKHSGFICIDIDHIDDVDYVKAQLATDRYVFAAWKSISGNGLAVLFKINPRKHLQSFNGLGEYLFRNYNLVIDQSCKDVSRARFISSDPDIFVNQGAAKFAEYPKPKAKALTRLKKTIFVKDDFEDVVRQLEVRNIDIVPTYDYWLAVCFAICDQFGESGEQYFHRISRIGSGYNQSQCQRQYKACLRNTTGSGSTLSTIYWLCRQSGIQTVSEKTKLIAGTAMRAKKGGRTQADTLKLLKEVERIDTDDSAPIVKQVFEEGKTVETDEDFVSKLELWLRQEYNIRRNVITRKIENEDGPMEQREFNTIYMQGKKLFEKDITYDIFDRLVHSDFTQDFNPFLEWIEKNKDRRSEGNIDKLCQSIITDMNPDYVRTFVMKWLTAIIEAIHGETSPLMLVLVGEKQNTGKTEFFRRLLPRDIRQYYAESKLDSGKDDEILMTQKLIIMDDEMAGKSKINVNKFKELSSKRWFSLREPYGRSNVDLKRLAVLAGTSNNIGVLNDPTGNRRIIPIHVLDIDKELYNAIDKTELLIEVYWRWKEEELTADLTSEQIDILNKNTTEFEAVSMEKELIMRYFAPAFDKNGEFLTTTDIKADLEKCSQQRISINKMGQELKNLGFERTDGYRGAKRTKGYYVYRNQLQAHAFKETEQEDDLPF